MSDLCIICWHTRLFCFFFCLICAAGASNGTSSARTAAGAGMLSLFLIHNHFDYDCGERRRDYSGDDYR